MKRTYEVAEQGDKRGLAEFLKRESQFLLPMVELVERTELAIDEVITVMGRATLEAVLAMSAEGVAGADAGGQGAPGGEAVWYGRQSGQVYLSDRKVRVERLRLRRRGQGTGGEVEVPAYEAMNRPGPVGQRMLEILLAGVSTRKYARVIPAMAETVGVSRSFGEPGDDRGVGAGARGADGAAPGRVGPAGDLPGRDPIRDYHVLGAVGVDVEGKKHVLGVREGASENAEVARALLEDLVVRARGHRASAAVCVGGSKALRSALDQVFGASIPSSGAGRATRPGTWWGTCRRSCRLRTRSTMRAAWKLEAKEGEQKLDQFARWLERDHPSAAASLREGLGEMFTINRLGLPPRAASLLDEHELDRQHPLGCATEDAPGDELEERDDGAPVGLPHSSRQRRATARSSDTRSSGCSRPTSMIETRRGAQEGRLT